MKKTFAILTFTLLFLGLGMSLPHSVFAVAKAIYPNAQDMQPAPAGISANIAHNIQSSDNTVAPGIAVEPANTPALSGTAPAAPLPPPHGYALWWALGIAAIALFIGYMIWQIQKTKL